MTRAIAQHAPQLALVVADRDPLAGLAHVQVSQALRHGPVAPGVVTPTTGDAISSAT
jgi:hypothetical protein